VRSPSRAAPHRTRQSPAAVQSAQGIAAREAIGARAPTPRKTHAPARARPGIKTQSCSRTPQHWHVPSGMRRRHLWDPGAAPDRFGGMPAVPSALRTGLFGIASARRCGSVAITRSRGRSTPRGDQAPLSYCSSWQAETPAPQVHCSDRQAGTVRDQNEFAGYSKPGSARTEGPRLHELSVLADVRYHPARAEKVDLRACDSLHGLRRRAVRSAPMAESIAWDGEAMPPSGHGQG
jgi:hypothetical protein